MDFKHALAMVAQYNKNLHAFAHVFGIQHKHQAIIEELLQEATAAGFEVTWTNPSEYKPADVQTAKNTAATNLANAVAAVALDKATTPAPIFNAGFPDNRKVTTSTAWPMPVGPAKPAANKTTTWPQPKVAQSNMWGFGEGRYLTEQEAIYMAVSNLPVYLNGKIVGYAQCQKSISTRDVKTQHSVLSTPGISNSSVTSALWPQSLVGRKIVTVRHIPGHSIDYAVE